MRSISVDASRRQAAELLARGQYLILGEKHFKKCFPTIGRRAFGEGHYLIEGGKKR